MDADRDEARGVVLKAIAVAIDEKRNEVDRPRPHSEDGREFCRPSLGLEVVKRCPLLRHGLALCIQHAQAGVRGNAANAVHGRLCSGGSG